MQNKIITEFKKFLLLLSFASRIPVPMQEYTEKDLGQSFCYYPIVGLVGGLGIFLSFMFIENLISLPVALYAVIVMLLELFFFGAMHLDGLADTADGIFSYRDKEEIFKIMKDPCTGSNAVLALFFCLLIKFVLLSELLFYYKEEGISWAFLLFLTITPLISRFSVVYSVSFFPYAKKTGMAKAFVDFSHFKTFLFSFSYVLLILFLFSLFGTFSFTFLFIILCSVLLFSHFFSKSITKKLGGSTGDTYGALLELSSLLILFMFFLLYVN